jgi:hypothetical protein
MGKRPDLEWTAYELALVGVLVALSGGLLFCCYLIVIG